jgi:hypothetical protein
VTVREELLDVLADFALHRGAGGEERIVGRRRSVVVQPKHGTGDVRIVRSGSTELVIRHDGAGTGGSGTTRQVLQVPAAAHVAHEHVQLSIAPERQDASIVIAALRLGGVLLNGPEADDVARLRQR